jgi:hypothetical protein
MISENRLHARDYLARLAASGRYHFGSSDAQKALGVSPAAAKLALHRLAKRGLIASPARGFYIIVPPEYRSLGSSLPADQFIPALMQRLGLTYYAGLLTAAQYHGAAHHRPQEFQVMLAKSRRPLNSGAVRVAFIVRKDISAIPVQSFNTPRGTVLVSTPEATAVDLVGDELRKNRRANLEARCRPVRQSNRPARCAVVSWGSKSHCTYGTFGPVIRYQSAICSPVQNSTSFFFRIFSKTLRKYFTRCGAPMM